MDSDSDRIPNCEIYIQLRLYRSKSQALLKTKGIDQSITEEKLKQNLDTKNDIQQFSPSEDKEQEDKFKEIHKLKETFTENPKYFCGSDEEIVNAEDDRDDKIQESIKFFSDYKDIEETVNCKASSELKETIPQKTRYFCGSEDDEQGEERKTGEQFDDKTLKDIGLSSDFKDIEQDGKCEETPELKEANPQKILYSYGSEGNIKTSDLWNNGSGGRLIGLPALIIYCVAMSLSCGICSAKIELALLDKTPQIGKDVIIICSYDKSDVNALVWLKGENSSQLTNWRSSKNPSKYIPDLVPLGDCNEYRLTIKHFGFDDFGRYVCQVQFHKKGINLPSDDTFIYVEKENKDEMQIFESEQAINLSVSFTKVHPKPDCRVVFDNNNYTDKLSRRIRRYPLYYDFTMFAMIPLDTTCHGTIKTECFLYGKKIRDFKKPVNRCRDVNNTNYLYILMVAVILVPIAVIIFKSTRKKTSSLQMKEENEKMTSLDKQEDNV